MLMFKRSRNDAQLELKAAKPGDVGADLFVTAAPKPLTWGLGDVVNHYDKEGNFVNTKLNPGAVASFDFGISVAIPIGYEGTIRSRSGKGGLQGLVVRQGIGTIDPGYRGNLIAIMTNISEVDIVIKNGDAICQFVVSPVCQPEWQEVPDLDETARGVHGFGSSGN